MKKKQLQVVVHIKNDNRRIIPIECLKDAINMILDYQSGMLGKDNVHPEHGDVVDEFNCLIAKINTYGKIELP